MMSLLGLYNPYEIESQGDGHVATVAILKAAWATYRIRRLGVWAVGDENGRSFLRPLFARSLRSAWDDYRSELVRRPEVLTPAALVSAVNLGEAMKAKRLADIEAELNAQQYSDAPTNWARRRDLQAERAALTSLFPEIDNQSNVFPQTN